MQFKTNAKCGGCVSAIGEQLNQQIKPEEWSIDLASPDKVLRVMADISEESVMKAVKAAGFKAEKL